MNENTIKVKSKKFAVRVVKLYRYLCNEKKEFLLSKQLLRSGTSIGANVAESVCSISKKDFLSKIYIALKECSETLYWLELLHETQYLSDAEYDSMKNDCEEMRKMMSSTTKTTLSNLSPKNNSTLQTPNSKLAPNSTLQTPNSKLNSPTIKSTNATPKNNSTLQTPNSKLNKVSIRFFDDREVRAVWDDEHSKWWFSVLDIVGVLRSENDYQKIRNYWKYLKAKLKREGSHLGSYTTQFKFVAPDGKKHAANVLDYDGIIELAKHFPSKQASRFIEWFTYSDETIDGKSKSKAYALFDSSLLDTIEVGTVRGLQQIHGYLFGGLYDFAGQVRTLNIAKGGFRFAPAEFLPNTLKTIEAMPEDSFGEIVDKYVEMNVAHPFMEGNGRSTRIWLDLILKKNLKQCVDWSKVAKREYLAAMTESTMDASHIKKLLEAALTDRINDREVFMKGVDYSYYYEQDSDITGGGK